MNYFFSFEKLEFWVNKIFFSRYKFLLLIRPGECVGRIHISLSILLHLDSKCTVVLAPKGSTAKPNSNLNIEKRIYIVIERCLEKIKIFLSLIIFRIFFNRDHHQNKTLSSCLQQFIQSSVSILHFICMWVIVFSHFMNKTSNLY